MKNINLYVTIAEAVVVTVWVLSVVFLSLTYFNII